MDQKIASGFNRNHMITLEGGAIPEEYHVEYVVDRVSTTSTAFLGLTMGCARCHDHKFDPITQKDFYRFFAFFNTVPERGLDGFTGNAVPVLPMPSHEQQQQLDVAQGADCRPRSPRCRKRKSWRSGTNGRRSALAVASRTLPRGPDGLLSPRRRPDRCLGVPPRRARRCAARWSYEEAAVAKGADFSPETQVSFGNSGEFERAKPFALSLWANLPSNVADNLMQKHEAGGHWQGWEVTDDKPVYLARDKENNSHTLAHIKVRLAARWPDDALEVQTKDLQPIDRMRHLLIEYDGSGKASGIEIRLDGKRVETAVLKDHTARRLSHHGAPRSGRSESGNAVRGPPGRPANLQPQAERFGGGGPRHPPAGACAAD